MKNLFWLVLLLAGSTVLYGQNSPVLEATGVETNTEIIIDSLPDLLPLGNDTTQPYLRYLWIFGDGNFAFGASDTIVHRYNAALLEGAAPYNPDGRVYLTDIYGGGDRPPDDLMVEIIIEDDTFQIGNPMPVARDTIENPSTFGNDTVSRTQAVPNGDYIQLQRNQDIRPQDTFVNIFSIKNQWAADIPNGFLVLFYNSKLRKTAYELDHLNVIVDSVKTLIDTFSSFRFNEAMIYYGPEMGGASQDTSEEVRQFEYFIAVPYYNLKSGEERHTFFEFSADSSMWDYVKGNQMVESRFLAVLLANNPDNILDLPPNVLSPQDSLLVQRSGLAAWLNALNNFDDDDDDDDDGNFSTFKNFDATTSQISQFFFQIIDVDQTSAEILVARDPNKLTAEACECPKNDQAHTVLCKIEFQNEGLGSTAQVHIEMDIPEALNPETLQDLLDYFPVPEGGSIGNVKAEHDLDNRKLHWTFEGFNFTSAITQGIEDPNTGGYVTFTLETASGFSLDDVGELEACITFGNLGSGDVVCTRPVKVSTANTAVTNANGDKILKCKKCTGDACATCIFCPFSWYYCFLMLAILLLVVILIVRWAAQPLQP